MGVPPRSTPRALTYASRRDGSTLPREQFKLISDDLKLISEVLGLDPPARGPERARAPEPAPPLRAPPLVHAGEEAGEATENAAEADNQE